MCPHLHNAILHAAAEQGLPSLLVYGWMMAAGIGLARRAYREGRAADLALASMLVLIGFNVASLFEDKWHDTECGGCCSFPRTTPLYESSPAPAAPADSTPDKESLPAPQSSYEEFLAAVRPEIDATLDRLVPAADCEPRRIHEAMRYSLFAGGKRVRPALTPARRRRPRRAARGLPGGRRRHRDDPHLQPDPRRPAVARQRRPAPRPARPFTAVPARPPRSWPAIRCSPSA